MSRLIENSVRYDKPIDKGWGPLDIIKNAGGVTASFVKALLLDKVVRTGPSEIHIAGHEKETSSEVTLATLGVSLETVKKAFPYVDNDEALERFRQGKTE